MSASVAAGHFAAFGVCVLPGFLDADATSALSSELDDCLADAFADPAHFHQGVAGNEFRYVPTMSERTPRALSLLQRLVGVAANLLGTPVLPSRAKVTLYRGSTGWHRDSDLALANVSFAFYLEPLEAPSGALCVLPGSHFADFGAAVAAHAEQGLALPGTPLLTRPGDAIAFDERLYHSSTGGSYRRQWRVDFVSDSPASNQTLRDYFARQYSAGWDAGYDVERYPTYGAHWRTLDAHWNARLAELGAYDAAAAEEALAREKQRSARRSL